MKKTVLSTLLATLLITSAYARHHGHHGHRNNHSNENLQTQTTNVDTEGVTELTQEQKDNLVFMYQEEKLARDVYITLANLYDLRVFKNITRSEQRHMDSVKGLLESYNIPVPVLSDDIGVFENEELQALYNELVEKGKQSEQDALEVGVAVEETDIADLEEKMIDAPSDIQRVFSNLLKGSYKHLNAFNSKL